MIKQITLLSAALMLGTTTFAQNVTKRSCASHQIHLNQLSTNTGYAERVAKHNKVEGNPEAGKKTAALTVYTIPVVVHVIHNGETVGSGQNISDAQINSAITALNNDFRKINADTLSPSHAFYSLQADIGMEFCLAKRDPSDQSTTGIMRYNKGQAAWTVNDFDATVKPSTAWDRTKYMNIWITSFAAPDDQTLGYATFPGTNTVQDGVVIGATFFGTEGNVSLGFDKNRTATHEVGHYFNLSHIWGDATCGDDLVADTPTQEQDNSGCPSFPHNANSSCNPGANGEMYMNYMDYVDDACMSMFSIGQRDRMRTALLGDRVSLTTSDGCAVVTNSKEVNPALVKVYPNPANAIVNVNLPTGFNLSSAIIYDTNGNTALTMNGKSENNLTINTSSLANGNYILKLVGENGIVNKELIIIQ